MTKKTLFLILAFAIAAITDVFAETYKVVCSNKLNVRQHASVSGRILGTLNNGELIDVVNFEGKWAEIQYKEGSGYVSASYIQRVDKPKDEGLPPDSKSAISMDMLNYRNFDKLKGLGDTSMVLWVLVPAFFLFYVFRQRVEDNGEWGDMRALSIVALVMSVLEIVYAMGSQDFIWFCVKPRWYWIALNFIVFAVCMFQQLMAYFTFAGFVSDGKGFLALYSWPVCLVLGIILNFCDVDPVYAVGLLLMAQLVQTGIIFYVMAKYRGFLSAIVYSFVYLVFTLSTALLLVQFLSLLIIVLIGYFILSAIANGSSSSSESSSSSSQTSSNSSSGSESYSDDSDKQEEEYYETPDGSRLHYDGFGKWHDNSGRHYENTDYWGGRRIRRTDDD